MSRHLGDYNCFPLYMNKEYYLIFSSPSNPNNPNMISYIIENWNVLSNIK
jgi:hypothetical protein